MDLQGLTRVPKSEAEGMLVPTEMFDAFNQTVLPAIHELGCTAKQLAVMVEATIPNEYHTVASIGMSLEMQYMADKLETMQVSTAFSWLHRTARIASGISAPASASVVRVCRRRQKDQIRQGPDPRLMDSHPFHCRRTAASPRTWAGPSSWSWRRSASCRTRHGE